MKIAVIGRTETLFDTILLLREHGFEIPLIITAKESPEYKKGIREFELLAKEISADFAVKSKLIPSDFNECLMKHGNVDLAISMNYTSVISQEVIESFRLGILNAHGGDLPRFRGNACQAWAIINGESRIGLIIHKMIGNVIDGGDIISRNYFPLNINSRIGQVYSWMHANIPLLFLEAVKKLSVDEKYILQKHNSNSSEALRCYPRIPNDGKIDWKVDNFQILRLINASSEPYSGAFCFFDDKILRVWRASIYDDNENYLAIPGQIVKIDNDAGCVVVATGKGKILLSDVECDGRRQKPSEIIKSIRKRLV